MPTKRRGPPESYEDIVRQTVPDPDSSWRPSRAQEQLAYEGNRVLDEDEEDLLLRVTSALRIAGEVDLEQIDIEIERTRVTLRGHVRSIDELPRIEHIIARVPGVEEIVDRLTVAAPTPSR